MERFWETKALKDLSRDEWESLCDGCGKCCMIRLEDEDTGDIHITNVACFLFERTDCACMDYPNRSTLVPDCVTLSPDNVADLHWMPETCAYKLVAHGKPLPEWHHLNTGDRESIHEAGYSVRDRSVCETEVADEDLEEHLVNWPGEPRRG